jgi:hypothetical protein
MNIKSWLLSAALLSANVHAAIPYCSGTEVTGSKHIALQHVINTFANENNCSIGDNCILNFNQVKYSIAWSKECMDSANKGNSPYGSTFVCEHGACLPLGFHSPLAEY